MRLIVLCVCISVVLCRLPPQFEREFYCPNDFCLQATRIHRSPSFSGPGSYEYECCNITNPDAKRAKVINWGEGCGQELKDDLLSRKYHTDECEPDSDCAMALQRSEAPVAIPYPIGAMLTLRRIDQLLSGPMK